MGEPYRRCQNGAKCFVTCPECVSPEISGIGRTFVFHAMRDPDACKHEWGGWRDFEDGRGGEQICKLCGMGAMTYSLRTGP